MCHFSSSSMFEEWKDALLKTRVETDRQIVTLFCNSRRLVARTGAELSAQNSRIACRFTIYLP
jgi:hypothetical protein